MRLALVTSLALLVGCATDPVDATPQEGFQPVPEDAAPVHADYDTFDLDDVDVDVRTLADRFVELDLGEDAPEDVFDDAEELQTRFAYGLAAAGTYDDYADLDEVVAITWLGKGAVAGDAEAPAEVFEGLAMQEVEDPAEPGVRWVGFSGDSHNEFLIEVPLSLSERIGLDAEDRGIVEGSTSLEGEGPVLTVQVGNADTRVLKGSKNTAHTATNFTRMVNFSNNCSGTLVGPHHVISAGHCFFRRAKNGNPALWIQPTLYVGRNGSDWISDVDTSTGSRWFWVDAHYYDEAKKGNSPKSSDIGLIITPTRHIGATTGWFGWQYSNSEHDDLYNRGYPGPAPLANHEDHLFGDTNLCHSGDFSSGTDSYGYKNFGYHSCDTSGGHSGSALYRNNSGSWVVRGVHKGIKNTSISSPNNSSPYNSFALVTRDRSSQISYFRSAYP